MRASLYNPPGAASSTDERRLTYQTALRQAEELFSAASHVSYAARPVLVYYALNQGGRAIAASSKAPEEQWKLKGHGRRATRQNHRLDVGLHWSTVSDSRRARTARRPVPGKVAKPVPDVADPGVADAVAGSSAVQELFGGSLQLVGSHGSTIAATTSMAVGHHSISVR